MPPIPRSLSPHDHRWTTASEHRTSEGRIVYQSCECGRWRLLRQHELTVVLAGDR